jgi:hypothetical protein
MSPVLSVLGSVFSETKPNFVRVISVPADEQLPGRGE